MLDFISYVQILHNAMRYAKSMARVRSEHPVRQNNRQAPFPSDLTFCTSPCKRLSLLKLDSRMVGDFKPRLSMMESLTLLVAVAVHARKGDPGKSSCRLLSARYAGLQQIACSCHSADRPAHIKPPMCWSISKQCGGPSSRKCNQRQAARVLQQTPVALTRQPT